MNGVNQWIENNKGIILKVLIILGITFCIFGVMNVIFENTIFNLLKNNKIICLFYISDGLLNDYNFSAINLAVLDFLSLAKFSGVP